MRKTKTDWKNISLKELAAVVSKKLKEHKLECILVGGACVSIYSQNPYQSYDLDYVTYDDMKMVTNALKELGFEEKSKYFKHPDCQFFIEFVSPPIAIGNEPVHNFEFLNTKFGEIKMLTPTDCVKDRLASYYYWNDKQALNQALLVCKDNSEKIDIKEIKRWSKQENHLEKFVFFLDQLKKISTFSI